MVRPQNHRKIKEIIVSSTFTLSSSVLTMNDIRRIFRDRTSYSKFGYHFVVMQDGSIKRGLPVYKPGLFCYGHNKHSIGVAYVGGRLPNGMMADTRTSMQRKSLEILLSQLIRKHGCKCVGIDQIKPGFNLGFDCSKEYHL